MASSQDPGDKSRVAADVPTNHKEAMFLLAKHRSQKQRENVAVADILRGYVKEGLAREENLPGEVKDLLDEDMVANAGAGESTLDGVAANGGGDA